MKFSVFQMSRIGGREKNEDRMGYCYTREASLFALADGMGGHPDGEIAAQLALQTISSLFQQQASPKLPDVKAFLESALLEAHIQILEYAESRRISDTPRTTLVAAVVQNGQAYWVHCGDSRLYVIRDGKLLVRTRDHSYFEQRHLSLVRSDRLNRNILFTCLGSPSKPVFDISAPLALKEHNTLLLCSDGVWGVLKDEVITHNFDAQPLEKSVPALVEQALQKGGAQSDNVTALAMQWEMPDTEMEERHTISTELMNQGVFASTIQLNLQDARPEPEMDEAAIERSIAEINEAIRKTALRKT